MEKTIMPILAAALVSLIAWNIATTNKLQLQVQRLEILLRADAMEN